MKCFETFKCLEKDGVYLGEITVNEPKFKNQLLDGSNTLLDLQTQIMSVLDALKLLILK